MPTVVSPAGAYVALQVHVCSSMVVVLMPFGYKEREAKGPPHEGGARGPHVRGGKGPHTRGGQGAPTRGGARGPIRGGARGPTRGGARVPTRGGGRGAPTRAVQYQYSEPWLAIVGPV